ncbi:hypothetical protein DUNSADRAFT_8876, partial [Dunaliella salina]
HTQGLHPWNRTIGSRPRSMSRAPCLGCRMMGMMPSPSQRQETLPMLCYVKARPSGPWATRKKCANSGGSSYLRR